MTTTEWILVAIALVGGVGAGLITFRVLRAVAAAPSRPQAIRDAARAVAALGLSICVVIGIILALAVARPSATDQLPREAVDFIPRLLAAAIIVVVAYVVSSLAQAGVALALAHAPANVQRQALAATRAAIVTLAVLLAVGQLGVDTTVLNLAVAALLFGAAGTLMLLIALGGRDVAVEVASTRAVRRLFSVGDRVQMGSVRGTVAAVHPTAVELMTADGRTILVPASHFVAEIVTVERRGSSPAPPPASS
jgi:small-conductance mechanosensitive channel